MMAVLRVGQTAESLVRWKVGWMALSWAQTTGSTRAGSRASTMELKMAVTRAGQKAACWVLRMVG